MMKIYGIYDRAIESFAGAPFFQPTNAAAMRAIKAEAQREGSQLNSNPTDFELHALGTFNEENGEIVAGRERVARVEDLLDNGGAK